MPDEQTYEVGGMGIQYTVEELNAMTSMFASIGWNALRKAASQAMDENIEYALFGAKPLERDDYLTVQAATFELRKFFSHFPREVEKTLRDMPQQADV